MIELSTDKRRLLNFGVAIINNVKLPSELIQSI